jgi:hypothetical protein
MRGWIHLGVMLGFMLSASAFARNLPQKNQNLGFEKSSSFSLPKENTAASQSRKRKFVPFDAKLYDLAYKTFIANENLTEAFHLAQKAVKTKPNSLAWRKKYAQVSSWLGYGEIAMEQWFYLIKKTNDPQIIQEAIRVAELTFDYPTLIDIYQYQLNNGVPLKRVVDGLAKTLVQLGEPEKALQILQQVKKPSDKSIIQLQVYLGKLDSALDSLQKEQKKSGLSVHNSIEQAEILFTMMQVKQAFHVLKEVVSLVKPDNKTYWDLMAELAWKENDSSLSVLSYERLYANGERNEIVLTRLGQLLQQTAPEKSLQLALENWRLHPSQDALYLAASKSHQLKNWPLFYNLFNMMPADKRSEHIDLYIYWALDQGLDALAIDLANKQALKKKQLPLPLRLVIAEKEHDHSKIKRLLADMKQSDDEKSYEYMRDAAQQIGEMQSAQEYAFLALDEDPVNTNNYQILQDLMLPRSDFIDANVNYRQNGPISGFQDFFHWQYYLTPSLYVQPFMNQWRIHSNDKTQIINVPGSLDHYGAIVGLKRKRGDYLFRFDQRHAVQNYFTAKFDWLYQWDRFASTLVSAGWQQDSDETTQLLVGGKKNFINLGGTYLLSAHDNLSVFVQLNQYQSQDQYKVGTGESYRLTWTHNFRVSYPNWNLVTYMAVNRYHNTGVTSPLLNSLLPVPSSAGLLPPSYYEVGMNIGVGQIYREEYTHSFKPFAEIGIFRHSVNGIGGLGTAGIAGSVFGRDHLALYASFSRGAEAAGQLDYSVGLEYKLYY